MKEISLHIMDLVQNSIRAEASVVKIEVVEKLSENSLTIVIDDNGYGMSAETLERAVDPFFTSRTTRKVGLGISLFKQMVDHCNGKVTIASEEGKGTLVQATMELKHIDRQPMGDIAGVMVLLISANPGVRFIYSHQTDKGSYVLDTSEVGEVLGDVPVNDAGVTRFLKEMIQENLNEIDTQS